MSSFLRRENEILKQRISTLEKTIAELVQELDTMQKNLQIILQTVDINNVKVISDIQSFQVGDNLITEKIGWVVNRGEVICEGDEKLYIEKHLPFSIVSIKTSDKTQDDC
ncbi:hypothetical protein [Clostridium formicaceticum]|nr:hypothetical protein [Clostridium formicaceticum]